MKEVMCGAGLDSQSEAWARINGGCALWLAWQASYRCVHCHRWYHLECIRKHFATDGVRSEP